MRQFFIPPTVTNIVKLATVKRSTIYTATITPHNQHPRVYQFVGPSKGLGPVVILGQGGNVQTNVLKPGLYGSFGPDWIINYFTEPH